ncbi:MAG TPA: GlsB/YeaQ/YmgE family stress response membrane protein [Ktedonosporobacter sp.]|nr:GlsB/YeaQ/YmgE family stress response membrane protein [Ktedonosporobacter sp.]
MLALQLILADGITLKLGDNVWTFDLNFLIYLIVAAVIGLVAEALVGRRLPFGFVGAIIAALVGAWLLTKVIIINGIGDINVYGVPIFRALVGAIILVAIWQLLTLGFSRGRTRPA